jgi:putative sterol carrier protein
MKRSESIEMTDQGPQPEVSSDPGSTKTFEPRGPRRVEALFEKLNQREDEPSFGPINGVYEFDIEGSGQWFFKLSNGAMSLENQAAQADCVISCVTPELIDIVEGRHNLVTAFLQGRVECTGDLALAVAFRRLLPVTL